MWSPTATRPRVALVAAVVAVVVALGIPARATTNAQTTADEPHYLLTALSLWEDRDLDYGDERAEARYWPFHSVLLPVQAERQPDGSRLAPHEPLLPVVLSVPVGLGGWVGAKLALAALAGVLAALTCWVLERRVGVRPPVAAGTAVIAGCSPPLVIYGSQVYPELLGALVVLAGFATLSSPRWSGAARWGTVAAVLALPWLNVKYSPVAAALAAGLLVRSGRERGARGVATISATLLGAGTAFAAIHLWWYGGLTAYAAGSHFASGELTVMGNDPDYAGRTGRLLGLLVDRDFGLAAWQPVALLAVPALVWWCMRRSVTQWWVLAAMVGAGWLTATFLALTMHGWWWPGRQTVIVLPLVVVAVGAMVDRWSPVARRVTAAVAVAGVWFYAWTVVEVVAGAHTLIVDFDRTVEPVGWVWRRLLPDLRADTPADAVLFALWLAATVAVVIGTLRLHRVPRRVAVHEVTA
jgi:hypothetical protein